ncbi:ATP-binding protein [Microlunatus sp. GCM10028923]|uniref:ATP-binding protein n=1 Tax=Microlunatus sp. GCM10028923 TaxID=3273400 RepID=UPI00360F18A4
MRPVSGTADPLVGRRHELALLRRRLAEARAGTGQLVLITGPAGIGKTRLVEELIADAPGLSGWGAALADAGMPALWPWARATRGLPGPSAAIAALAGGAERGNSPADEAAATTFAAETAVLDALAECAAAGPGLLIVLDDLQWADQATLRLLDRVAGEIRRLPLLLVGTHRDSTGAAAEGPAHRAGELIGLGPLSPTEAAEVLAGAVEQADPAAIRHATRLSGGSPLFLRTLARVATDQLRGQVTWDETVGEQPELRHLVAAALRAAGPDAAELVAGLSVLGTEAEPGLLAKLIKNAEPVPGPALIKNTGVIKNTAMIMDAGMINKRGMIKETVPVLERLRPAVPAGLVELPAGGTRVRFAHALVRDAAYASIPAPRRAALHRAAALLLEPTALAGDDRTGAVALHWQRAGEPGQAAVWAVRAADAARAAGAYDDAARYLELALAAGPAAEIDRAELLLDLARVQYLAGRLEQSAATSLRAAAEGELTGRSEVVGRAAIIVQGIAHPAINQQLLDLCRRALALLGESGPPRLRARVEAQLSCVLLELDLTGEAGPWARTAYQHAVEAGDADAELEALRARATLEWRPGFDAEMIMIGRRALVLAEQTGRPLARLWAHIWCSDGAIHQADMGAAQREVGAMQVLADRTGLPLVRWHLLRRQSTLAGLVGDFDRSRRLSAQAAEIAVDWGDASVYYTHFAQSVFLAVIRGDPGELMPGWPALVAEASQFPPVGQAGLAMALVLVGRRDEAAALYRAALPGAAEPNRVMAAAALAYLPDLAIALGDLDACRMLRELIERTFGDTLIMGAGTVHYGGAVDRILGELSLTLGDPVAAVERFESGLRVDERVGARPFLVLGHLGLARALTATGDYTGAASHARTAADQAQRLDLPGPRRTAEALLAALTAGERVADPLSTREREVLALVAQALPNREIAARLVVSERTVESHVRRILAKTGLTSRTELTRWFLGLPKTPSEDPGRPAVRR